MASSVAVDREAASSIRKHGADEQMGIATIGMITERNDPGTGR